MTREHFVSVKQSGRMIYIQGNPPGERYIQKFWVDPLAVRALHTRLYDSHTYVCRVVTDDGSFSFLFDDDSQVKLLVDAVAGHARLD